MTETPRHLAAVPTGPPAAETPARPTPRRPKPGPPPFPRNPLLDYVVGPDVHNRCPACHWVKAQLGYEYCPHHVAWRDIKAHAVTGAGDIGGPPAGYPATQPVLARGQYVWFQGKLKCRITQRYWGSDGRWRYVATTVTGGSAVDSHEGLFATEPAGPAS